MTMNSSSKKWFVSSSRGQEGPFQADEVSSRLKRNEIPSDAFIRSEDMKDWRKISESDEFKHLVPQHSASSARSAGKKTEELSALMELKTESGLDTNAIDIGMLKAAEKEAKKARKISNHAQRMHVKSSVADKPSRAILWTIIGLVLLGLAGAAFWWLNIKGGTISGTPATLESRLPAATTLPAEDKVRLEEALKAQLDTLGPRLAMAVAPYAPGKAPIAYVAVNLPGDQALELDVLGIPSTLIGERLPLLTVPGRLQNGVATFDFSPVLSGRALSQGEYWLSLAVAGDTSTHKAFERLFYPQDRVPEALKGKRTIFLTKEFLGGARDAAYTSQVRGIRLAVVDEMEKLLNSSLSTEAMLRTATQSLPKARPQNNQKWLEFHVAWLTSAVELEKRLTDSDLTTWGTVKNLHEIHNSWFQSVPADATYPMRKQDATTQATSAVDQLKKKLSGGNT